MERARDNSLCAALPHHLGAASPVYTLALNGHTTPSPGTHPPASSAKQATAFMPASIRPPPAGLSSSHHPQALPTPQPPHTLQRLLLRPFAGPAPCASSIMRRSSSSEAGLKSPPAVWTGVEGERPPEGTALARTSCWW